MPTQVVEKIEHKPNATYRDIIDLIQERHGVSANWLTSDDSKIQPQASFRSYVRYACIAHLGMSPERVAKKVAKKDESRRALMVQSATQIRKILEKPDITKPLHRIITEIDREVIQMIGIGSATDPEQVQEADPNNQPKRKSTRKEAAKRSTRKSSGK